jgi:hypothetical protein
MAMEMKELERIIDERSAKQIDSAKAEIKKVKRLNSRGSDE